MADYYPLLLRAVGSLDNNTDFARSALYERARSALVNQMRGFQLLLDDSDIISEMLMLEEAIQKIEAEATGHSRTWDDDDAKVRPAHHKPPMADAEKSRLKPSAPSSVTSVTPMPR